MLRAVYIQGLILFEKKNPPLRFLKVYSILQSFIKVKYSEETTKTWKNLPICQKNWNFSFKCLWPSQNIWSLIILFLLCYYSHGNCCATENDSKSKRVSRAESWRYESNIYVNPRNRARMTTHQLPYQIVPQQENSNNHIASHLGRACQVIISLNNYLLNFLFNNLICSEHVPICFIRLKSTKLNWQFIA